MPDKMDTLIKALYEKWSRKVQQSPQEPHPHEEDLACFLEGRLSEEEEEKIKRHILECQVCAEAFALALETGEPEIINPPDDVLERIRSNAEKESQSASILEIILKLKGQIFEIINSTGDILVGQELMPAPVLRSRSISGFKDEVRILKEFRDILVEAHIQRIEKGECFRLSVIAKDKATQKAIKDLRVTLIRDDVELESYISDAGKVSFEHVLLGKYTVEISSVEARVAAILLDIRA